MLKLILKITIHCNIFKRKRSFSSSSFSKRELTSPKGIKELISDRTGPKTLLAHSNAGSAQHHGASPSPSHLCWGQTQGLALSMRCPVSAKQTSTVATMSFILVFLIFFRRPSFLPGVMVSNLLFLVLVFFIFNFDYF